MTDRDEIIRMAREAGFVAYGEDAGEYRIPTPAFYGRLERFAALVAAAEREAACRIVTGLCISDNNAREICEAIRARGEK